jgi:hypothetical protein
VRVPSSGMGLPRMKSASVRLALVGRGFIDSSSLQGFGAK